MSIIFSLTGSLALRVENRDIPIVLKFPDWLGILYPLGNKIIVDMKQCSGFIYEKWVQG